MKPAKKITLFDQINDLLEQARTHVVRNVNHTMVRVYFEIGRVIIEDEQKGKARAEYGLNILKDLSRRLTRRFGKGFSIDNLENMRKFYLAYSISETVSRKLPTHPISSTVLTNSVKKISSLPAEQFKLSWSHYLKLMRIDDPAERQFYEIEAATNNWSLRELQRQFDSGLYQRLALSRNKKKVRELAIKGQVIETPQDAIKDPYILEFIGLPEKSVYSESELEEKIISKLEHFLMELGKGFTFVARQERLTIDEKHFYIDLVFYNRILRCFVLVDLKIGELKHQDLGQIQMYVNFYDRFKRLPDENPTVGIVLCRDKSDTLVQITLPENNKQIFASKYKTVLPSKTELKQLLERKD